MLKVKNTLAAQFPIEIEFNNGVQKLTIMAAIELKNKLNELLQDKENEMQFWQLPAGSGKSLKTTQTQGKADASEIRRKTYPKTK